LEKKEIDQLYHLLRRASNITDEEKAAGSVYSPDEKVSIIYGLCRHLLAGGDYSALIQFSQFYGVSFLLEPVFKAIKKLGWKPSRIVDLGAGLGWLGRGLSAKFGLIPALFVDKRPWPLVDFVADLETDTGIKTVLGELREGDLIVASDLLHCLDKPATVMGSFSAWPMAILEYCPEDDSLRVSYSEQISRFGASPLEGIDSLVNIFKHRKTHTVDLDP